MITIHDIFDADLFAEMVEKRYVNVQTSPNGSLKIANYSSNAQFDRVWNDVTMNCRGLIYDAVTLEVVARGFKKFFNWDDSSQQYPPSGPCLRSPKMDGSLGILYVDPEYDEYKIATRGSFTSDQAIKATSMLEDTFQKHFNAHSWDQMILPKRDRTYLFEIIYPDNRIVVDYGQDERLVLLDVLVTDLGISDMAEFDNFLWPDKVERITMPGFTDTMASDIPQGEEGFVLYWPYKDFRTKMKSAEYVELHRMIFGFNERTVWERLGEGETIQEIASPLPDEFYPWVKSVADGLERRRQELTREIMSQFREVRKKLDFEYTRKDFAEVAVKYPLKSYLFMLEDGRDIGPEIWKTLRPVGDKGIQTQGEDVA